MYDLSHEMEIIRYDGCQFFDQTLQLVLDGEGLKLNADYFYPKSFVIFNW